MTNNIVVADAFNGVVRPLAEGDRFVVTLPVQRPQPMKFIGLGRSAGNYAGVYRLPEDFHPTDCMEIHDYTGPGKARLIGYLRIEAKMTKINVVNLDLPVPAPVAVNPPHECLCDFLLMSPARAVNYEVDCPFYICECCGGLIDEDAMMAYNEYYGYSGFDECYEEDYAAA